MDVQALGLFAGNQNSGYSSRYWSPRVLATSKGPTMTGAQEVAQNVSKDKMSDYQKRSTIYTASENMAAWVRVKERGNEGGRERGR